MRWYARDWMCGTFAFWGRMKARGTASGRMRCMAVCGCGCSGEVERCADGSVLSCLAGGDVENLGKLRTSAADGDHNGLASTGQHGCTSLLDHRFLIVLSIARHRDPRRFSWYYHPVRFILYNSV